MLELFVVNLLISSQPAIQLPSHFEALSVPYRITNPDPSGEAKEYEAPLLVPAAGEQAGTTTYDFQQNGAMGNRIAVDASGNAHLSWTHSIDLGSPPSFADRDIFYNFWDAQSSNFTWPTGIKVSGVPKAGYTTLGTLSSGAAVVAFHHDPNDDGTYESAVVVDAASGEGAFSTPLSIDPTSVPEQPIWPHIVVGANNHIHVTAKIYWDGNGERPANYFNLYYSRSTDGGQTFSPWQVLAQDATSDVAIATSKDGSKVAIAWVAGVPVQGQPGEIAQFGHVKYRESTNSGQTWGTEKNITAGRYPSGLGYIDEVPDEDQAYRAFANSGEIDCAYDNSGNINILFADGLHYYYDTDSWFNYAFYGRINHWNQASGFSIPSGPEPVIWVDDEQTDTFAFWGINYLTYEGHNGAYTPQIAIWGTKIVAVWGGQRDTLDLSAVSTVNGDIYSAVSYDNGKTWSPLLGEGSADEYYSNLTNTHTPGAVPGSCDDEDYLSIWPRVENNDILHMTYVNDKFAGSVVGDPRCNATGVATTNPVIYWDYPLVGIEEEPASDVRPELLLVQAVSSSPVTVAFSAPLAEPGLLRVRNVLGQKVYEEALSTGTATLVWEGKDALGRAVPAGVYFMELQTSSFRSGAKVTLLK